MLKNSPRRLWALIGAGGTLAVVALGYVFFISGQKSQKADYEDQIASVQQQSVISRHKVADLEADNKKLPIYRAQLKALEAALPHTEDSSSLLDDLHQLSKQSHVALPSCNFPQPASSTTPPAATTPDPTSNSSSSGQGSTPQGASWTPLAVNITAQGTTKNLDTFLNLVQAREPRAVVVTTSTQTQGASGGNGNDLPTLTLNLNVFYTNS